MDLTLVLHDVHPDFKLGENASVQLKSFLKAVQDEMLRMGTAMFHTTDLNGPNILTVLQLLWAEVPTMLKIALKQTRDGKYIKHMAILNDVQGNKYLNNILYYVSSEILELAGNSARDSKRDIITVRDLFMAVEEDYEMRFIKSAMNFKFMGSGIRPNIDNRLLPLHSNKLYHQIRLDAIRKAQNDSECYLIPMDSFDAGLHAIESDMEDKKNGLVSERLTGKARAMLQYTIEDQVVGLLKTAQLLALHANRIPIMPKDVNLADKLRMGKGEGEPYLRD